MKSRRQSHHMVAEGLQALRQGFDGEKERRRLLIAVLFPKVWGKAFDYRGSSAVHIACSCHPAIGIVMARHPGSP